MKSGVEDRKDEEKMGLGQRVVLPENNSNFRRKARRSRLLGTTAFAILCRIALVSTLVASPVEAQEQSARSYNIPAQPLASAISAFGRQSGLQVTIAAGVAGDVRSSAVSGTLSSDQALARMLAGTGLPYRINPDGTAVIGHAQPVATGFSADGSTVLDPIVITSRINAAHGSGFQGTPDWVYESPSAVSVVSREAIQSSAARNARDLLDNVAGVYANRSEAQNPGIAVNIRGIQDQDRVAMMVDGARQSFQRAGHGATQRTYVDTAFIREIDVEKSSTSGVGSLGSLGGSVNFRTLVADDLIQPDRDWGVELNGTTGTNGYNFDGSAAAAVRLSDSFSILGGISHKNIGAYEVGKNGTVDLGTTYNGDTMLFSGQEVLSSLLKAEADITDDARLTLGWVRNDSDFSTGSYDNLILDGGLSESQQSILNNTLTASLDWDPDSDLIDLKARLYYNHTKNTDIDILHDVPDDVIIGDNYGLPSNYKMGTIGGSIENTSSFDTSLGLLSLNYGAEAFHDDGETIVPPETVDGQEFPNAFSGGNATGKRDVAGGFVNAKLEHDDWLTVAGGVRYDWYRISGSTSIFGNRTRDIIDVINHPGTPPRCPFPTRPTFCIGGTPGWTETIYGDWYYPEYNVNVDRSDGAFLPTFMVAVKPYDWLQPFVKYSKSFRPPTIMESFLNSGHSGIINGYAPNPNLMPERADTYELGVNVSQDGLFSADDSLRLKVVGFYRDIDDYIALGRIHNAEANRTYAAYVNLNGTTRMKGVEVEANYDTRSWYIGGTFTYNHTDWAKSYDFNGVSEELGPDTSVLFVQPKVRFAIDGGVRLFEEKLTLGGRITHVGDTEPTIGTLQNSYKIENYTLLDLYGSYAFNDTTKLRVAVNNVTDKAYVSALGADYYAMPGRTFTASLHFKF